MDSIIEKLKYLQCPLPLITKSLLEERWVELLTWLLRLFDSTLFDRICSDLGNDTKDYVSAIFNTCSLIGMCGPNDRDIIKGTAKVNIKVEFLANLVSLVSLQNSPQDQISHDSVSGFLKDVIDDSKALMSKNIVLFPLDMDPLYSSKTVSSVPSHLELEDMVLSTQKEAEKLQAELDKLNATTSNSTKNSLNSSTGSSGVSKADIQETKTILKRQFERLGNVLSRFQTVYLADIQPWSTQSPPQLHGIGPESVKVLELQQSLQTVLDNIKSLKSGYAQIVSPQLTDIVARNDMELTEHKIIYLQEQIGIMEKSAARIQEIELLSE